MVKTNTAKKAFLVSSFEGHVILLTSDNGLQLKARGLGLRTQSLRDFLN